MRHVSAKFFFPPQLTVEQKENRLSAFSNSFESKKIKITSRTGDKKSHCRPSKTRVMLNSFLDHGVAVHHEEALTGQTISQHF
jgi:hypothetical protein